ncbi:hypothetical protein [Helicobacter felis]|uniref:hypothetical protein n=1 Tax=Helicobacter felis TaxID=214 RepID=UPI000CF12FDE|nr:hypothetical protein [Helicobacter felis]
MHRRWARVGFASLLLVLVLLACAWLLTRVHPKDETPQPPKWSLDKGTFLNASQELYNSMLGAFKETTKGMLCPKDFDPDIYSVDMVKKYAPTWINLASKMVDALPTIKAIQAQLPPPLAQEIRSFEILHAIALMRYKIPGMDCYDDPDFYTMVGDPEIQPLNPEVFLENFSTSLEVVYPLLIQAFKQGLDLKEYLRFLGEKLNWEMSPMLEYSLPNMVQDFFHNFRLIAFKQPCLYLTPQNTIQTFPSQEPLCQILKDNPPNVSAPLPKGLVQAFQNAQDFLIRAFNEHKDKGITLAQIKPALSQHLQAIIQATPLLAPLKGKEWDHLLDYTQSQLLTLLQAYMRKANETSSDLHHIIRSATFIAQDYLHMLDLIYPSLLQAKKQGLDPSLYLKALQVSKPLQARPCKNPCNPTPDIASRGYPKDLMGMDLAQKLALHQRIVEPCNRCVEGPDELEWDVANQRWCSWINMRRIAYFTCLNTLARVCTLNICAPKHKHNVRLCSPSKPTMSRP